MYSEDALRRVSLPTKTETYTPISHGDMIDTIRSCMNQNDLNITDSVYRASENGNKLIGSFHFDFDNSELGGQIVFRNSYDKSMSAALAVGTIVWICSNGMIGSNNEFVLRRKHTGTADSEIFQYTQNAINSYGELHRMIQRDVEKMKEIPLRKIELAHLIGEMYLNEELMTATQLGIIKKEMDFSKHFPIVDNIATLWQIYNWCTESYKKSHPMHYLQDHMNLHQYMQTEMSKYEMDEPLIFN